MINADGLVLNSLVAPPLDERLEAHVAKDAAIADAQEHQNTVKEAFRIHKKAIFWSMALSGALIMEGELEP